MRYQRVILPALIAAVGACGHGGGRLSELMTSDRFDELLVEAEACVAKTPQRAECLEARARALDGLGREGAAAEAWRAVLNVDPAHVTAWERLARFVDTLPAPSYGTDLLRAFTPSADMVSPERREAWAAGASRADSVRVAAVALGQGAEWERGVQTLRAAMRLDRTNLEIRRALCTALRDASERGESWAERTAPLHEVILVCSDEGLPPSTRAQLDQTLAEARTRLEQERTSFEAARTYRPWPGARFDASIDSMSYYPKVTFRCDETKWADITMDFAAQQAQYTLVGERVSLLQYPRPDSPPLGTVVGSGKGAPSVVVLAEVGDYRLISVGGLKGWVRSGNVAVKHRFTAEIKPRGSLELRVRPATAHIRIDVEGMNVFRGDVDLKPYLVYRWSF